MRGVTYNKTNRTYQAQIYYNGETKGIGQFHDKLQAKKRYDAAVDGVKKYGSLYDFLLAHPNKKSYQSDENIFEREYNEFLEGKKEPKSKDGYHFKMRFRYNNIGVLQKRYANELEGKEAIIREVPFFDFGGNLFRSKKINFKYWRNFIATIGKEITYCNHDMTADEVKNALFRVFQRNVYIPIKMQPRPEDYQTFWGGIGKELDEITMEAIYGTPEKNPKSVSKIIFSPEYKGTPDERKKVVTELCAGKKVESTLERLKSHYKKGMAKKALSRLSGMSIDTVRKHWATFSYV